MNCYEKDRLITHLIDCASAGLDGKTVNEPYRPPSREELFEDAIKAAAERLTRKPEED